MNFESSEKYEDRKNFLLKNDTLTLINGDTRMVFKETEVFETGLNSGSFLTLYQNKKKEIMEERWDYVNYHPIYYYTRVFDYPYLEDLVQLCKVHGASHLIQPHYSNNHIFSPYFPTPEMAYNFHENFHEKLMEMAEERKGEINQIVKNKKVLLSGGIDYFREYLESFFKK